MDNQLDPQALALAKAIRRTETGGHKDPYNARGASGEFGAFQFMPATYKSLAQKHLGNANAAPTVENQNKIVYSEIKSLKDQGYNPAQIASIWNSGKPDRYKNGGVGVNKYGVSYNVPQYVSKVSQNYKALIGTVQPVQQQVPEQPVEPTIEQQKQERIAQGLPVSVREDRAEPTFVGGIIRGAIKPFASAVTTVVPAVRSITEGNQPFEQTYRPVKTNYLGDVYSPGAKGIIQLDKAKNVGDVLEGTTRATADIAGKAIEIGSYGMGGSTVAGLKGIPAIKQGIVEGAKLGAVGGFGSGLQAGSEQDTVGGALGQVALQTGAGALVGGALGGATTGIARGGQNFLNRNKPEVISSKIDNEIANIFKGTTGDIDKIRESSFKARKGIELLQKESPNIKIPDENAPLGTRETKAFNPAIAKPNELLSGVKEMDNLIVSKMKKATEDARSRGFEVNTNDAKLIIRDAIDSGDIPKASGERMLKQLDSIGNDPVKAHDWVQDVNMKYKKKYERGTIEDTAVGSLADDVAQVLRDNLDLIVDRKGYAEAYGNNQELKRMLVAIAKKANKQVNWGDITTDSGLDAAISILTGNPAYMARTVATSVFKNIWNKFRNNAGLRSFRSAVKGTAKVGTETRLPFSVAKPQFKSKNLLPEGKGFENKAGIQLGKPKVPTTFEPRAKVVNTQPRVKQLGLPAPKNVIELPKNVTKTTPGSDATENAVIRNKIGTPKKSITKQVVKTEPKIVKSKTLPTKNGEVITQVGDKKFTIKSPERIYNKGTRIVGEYNGKEYITNSFILEFSNDANLVHDFPRTPKGPDSNDIQTLINKSKDGAKDIGKPVSMGDSAGDKVFIFKDGTKVNPDYYNYFVNKYDNVKFEHRDGGAIMVSSNDKMVGLLMPYNKVVENKNIIPIENVVKPKRIISEESYKKALKNLGDTSTLNSTPIHLSKDALIVAGYHIENGVRSAAELGIELAKKGYKFTKEQLEELFNKANKNVEIEPLIQEAKKYKSAEEFVKSQPTVYRGEGGSNVAQGKALLAEGKHYASDAEYPKGFGKVEEYVLKPKAKVLDLGDSTFAEISQKLGIPERNYISPKELASIAKEKGYDVVKYTGEYKSTGKQFIHTVDLTGDSYITKSQLEEIWNKANKSPLPKAKKSLISIDQIKENDKNLIVLHNISENKLKYSNKLGGLPVPSIAISRKDFPLENFGDITLIADKSLIDPSIASNKVFNADVYSKRSPKIDVDIKNSKPINELVENVKSYFKDSPDIDFERYSNTADSIIGELQDSGLFGIRNKEMVKRAFAAKNGISKTADIKDIDKLISSKPGNYDNFLEDLLKSSNANERIFKGYTYSGRRRYVPADLENFVKEMKGTVKDSEGYNYGVPSLRATQAKQFKSIKSIKDSRNKLIPKIEMDKLGDIKVKEFDALLEKHDISNISSFFDNLKDFMKGKITSSDFKNYSNVDDIAIKEFSEFSKTLKDMPTEYFEAKPQRAVGLEEFKIAVVPSDISKDAESILKSKGIEVAKYNKDIPNSRKDLIKKLSEKSGLAFSFAPLGLTGLPQKKENEKTGLPTRK